MNAELSAIAQAEGAASRYMPAPPAAHHDHGGGRVEEVPLVTRVFLLGCGVEALYLVCEDLAADERHDATTKEELADLILAKTQGQQPTKEQLAAPMIPPPRMTASDKRFQRGMKQQVKEALREARTHGDN